MSTITAKELIMKLQSADPEAEILLYDPKTNNTQPLTKVETPPQDGDAIPVVLIEVEE